MPNVQWNDIPFLMISPNATLIDINPLHGVISPSAGDTFGPQWILIGDGCTAGAAKRVVRDNTPQKPGEIIHHKYKTGVVFQLTMIACDVQETAVGDDAGQEMKPVCGSDLVDLFDKLMLALDGMENADGRLVWTPTGHVSRMLDSARWLGSDSSGGGAQSLATSIVNETFTQVQFSLLSPFPYAMDYAQVVTPLDAIGTGTITNAGTADFYPVILVDGPATSIQIDVVSFGPPLTGTNFYWNTSFPGSIPIPAGQTVEFDFFRETAYMGPTGSGAYDVTNMKPGIDVLNSDFWTLKPGVNTVFLTGDAPSGQMLWQNPYGG